MQQTVSQCTNCGAFTRRSLHHEEEYQSSVFLERLRTSNFPATDEEISHIRDTILPTVSDDISSIESKVASLHQVIRSMGQERERLKNVHQKYNNLISLHRTLPLEIWSEIFLYTLSNTSDSNALDASGIMWQLSHVCQRWRNIALSLRSLWSTIDLHFPKAAQHEADVQCLEAVLHRSREGLLDVSLRHDIPSLRLSLSSYPSFLQRMLDIVVAESYRWRHLFLSDHRGHLSMLYAPLHNRLPRLECLDIYCADMGPKERLVFKDCPRLRKFSLVVTPLLVELPWDQITELDLSCMDFDDEEDRRACMRLIGQCPSLQILSTPSWNSEDDEDESAYAPITCWNMRELSATSVPVIDALTLPHLRECSLNSDPPTTHYGILRSFKQLLIRSNCLSALTSLSLASVPLDTSPEHSLLSILSQTHSLTLLDLEVSMQEFSDLTDIDDREQIVAIVKSLEVVPTETVTFLPLLSSLNIRVYNHSGPLTLPYFGPLGSLASTLKSRWEGDDMVGLARLRTCHFTVQAKHLKYVVSRDDHGSVVPRIFTKAEGRIFNALIDDGMDLTIRVTSDLIENEGDGNVVFAVRR
ncbi:hypothetical protein BDZ89DRAFT_1062342 [Hymenopellis radicata]|nr:hypothetical protein BDZ89DRAFT_1062342 [Hymenopellis radicata]